MYTQDHYTVHISITPTLDQLAETVREIVYTVTELVTVLRTYGRVLSGMMRGVHIYSVRAYSPGGTLLGMQEWRWDRNARAYVPADDPWVPWSAIPLAPRQHRPPDLRVVA